VTSRRDLDDEARRTAADLARRGLSRAVVATDGLVDLVTNDSLGLRRDPRVLAAAAAALAREGLGAGGSRLLGGDHAEHRALEADLARWTGEEAAVLFATGTAANVGVLGALAGPADLVVSDAENHGSLVDGIRLCGARKAIVPHGEPEAVDRALAGDAGRGRRFVVVETLHGMNGDAALLAALADVCRRRGALLVADEAHAIGVLGPEGAGLVAEAGVRDVVAARVLPCGKALAGAGGAVACSAAVASLLVQTARAFAFTTALPPAVAAGVRAAAEVARAEPARRERCRALVVRTRDALVGLGARVSGAEGGFVSWVLGTPEAASAAAERLRAAGFAARPVRPPTVPEGTSRLRLALHADLAEADFERLLAALPVAARGAP
jgi:8-amino-7-oxononanoate synthase